MLFESNPIHPSSFPFFLFSKIDSYNISMLFLTTMQKRSFKIKWHNLQSSEFGEVAKLPW